MAEPDLFEAIRRIWAEVLDVESVPDDAKFFDAGGDSILLILLLDRLNALTGRTLEPPDLFQYSTIRAQAALLDGSTGAAEATPRPDRSALLARSRRDREGG